MSGHLHVIIPTHNRVALLQRCLDCLASQDDEDFSVIVVNDGSSDGTEEMLRTRFPSVLVVQGDGNLWWTGAVHKAIEDLRSRLRDKPEQLDKDAIVLLNDDLEFNAGFISTLRSIRQQDPELLIGSVVVNIKDRTTITHGGWVINWYTSRSTYRNRGADIASFPPEHSVDVSTLTGRGVLIPLKVLEHIGSYKPDHYPQHGDYELPARAARAGYKLKTFYKSIVYCHFDLDGDINNNKTYGISDVHRLLFDRRSYLNVRERFWFAVDTRQNPLQFVSYFCFSMVGLVKALAEKLYEHYTRQ